jgi:hypothetical protein
MEAKSNTNIYVSDLEQMRSIAEKEGFTYKEGNFKGRMNSAETMHHIIQDYLGRRT